MEHRNISLFRGYSDTESVETSLEEIVNIIKCDAALRDRTEKHRYYLQQDLRRDADREKSGCPCFAVAVCFEGGKTREHICAWTGYTLVDLDHIAPERMAATLTLICADKYTLMAYTTISGHGIRIICRIDDLNGAEKGKSLPAIRQVFQSSQRLLFLPGGLRKRRAVQECYPYQWTGFRPSCILQSQCRFFCFAR